MVLHRDETGDVEEVAGVERLRQLPGKHARGANVIDHSLPDQVVESDRCLLDRRRIVPAVNLVQVDPVCLEPPERLLYL